MLAPVSVPHNPPLLHPEIPPVEYDCVMTTWPFWPAAEPHKPPVAVPPMSPVVWHWVTVTFVLWWLPSLPILAPAIPPAKGPPMRPEDGAHMIDKHLESLSKFWHVHMICISYRYDLRPNIHDLRIWNTLSDEPHLLHSPRSPIIRIFRIVQTRAFKSQSLWSANLICRGRMDDSPYHWQLRPSGYRTIQQLSSVISRIVPDPQLIQKLSTIILI